MLTIRKVTVSGTSVDGDFAGTIGFGRGLQIVSAPNKFGKSLITSAIAWCLNLEMIYGYSNGDNSIFQGGILERVELGEREVPVHSLRAEIEITTSNDRLFRITRSILGNDRKNIEVAIPQNQGEEKRIRLITGAGSLVDPNAGFQAWIFSILGLPIQSVLNKDGATTNLYFENIAPLFFIEQISGWINLQSRQIYRYRIEEVTSVALEYVLGLDSFLKERLHRQAMASGEVNLRIEVIGTIKEFIRVMNENGWMDPQPSPVGSLDSLFRKFSNFKFADFLKEHFNYDYTNENKQLTQAKKQIQKNINEGFIDQAHRATYSELSSRLIELRDIKRKRNEEISILRNQKLNQDDVLRVLEARLNSARDLMRLKNQHVGDISETECPTCHRSILAEELHVTVHSTKEVEIHIDSLEKEIRLVKGSLDKIDQEVKSQLFWSHRVEEELSIIERKISLISSTIGSEKEAIIKLSSDLTDFDRRIERNDKIRESLESYQRDLDLWTVRVKHHSTGDATTASQESPRLESFLDELRIMLVAVGHGALTNHNPNEVYLDNLYNPCIRSRPLTRIGSASDRARLVLAYTLALLKVAVTGGHHPGFVVLDEPLQQNPDRLHRELAVKLLETKWPEIDGQVLVFTNVLPSESKRLRVSNAPLNEITERRFLKPTLRLA